MACAASAVCRSVRWWRPLHSWQQASPPCSSCLWLEPDMSLIRKLFPPLASGFLFGMGLTVSGMTEPQRVRGFLDVFGDWDPTLAFVMGGAVLVMAVAWRFQARMAKPVFGATFSRSEGHTSELQSP